MHNTCGRLLTLTTFGESHGPAVGCVVDGCPSLVPLAESDIQPLLDLRRPGRNAHVTERSEEDRVRILSGTFNGVTTGAPIALIIENRDRQSTDYDRLADVFRPGHADYAYFRKYGVRDHRGGGRASARETAARVAGGAVAGKVLKTLGETRNAVITACLIRMGPVAVDPSRRRDGEIRNNPFFCPDPAAAEKMAGAVEQARAEGNSLGGVVEIRAANVPPGLGEPVYDRLDARIGQMFMGLNAVKGVEIGSGFAAAASTGRDNNDLMAAGDGNFLSNHAGGILGGISTGQEIVVRCAVKPTPSIPSPQRTVNTAFGETTVEAGGRHDPCAAVRAVPVMEAMMALILADFALLARAGAFHAVSI